MDNFSDESGITTSRYSSALDTFIWLFFNQKRPNFYVRRGDIPLPRPFTRVARSLGCGERL
ncbi:MAG TPA: hypothetical protein ACHBZA_03355, partial [Arsenophonus apicola]